MENRVFFPQSALDKWLVDGSVDLQQSELTILGADLGGGRRYRLIDAVRVLREVAGGVDVHELVGRVKARSLLEELGAEIVESSMLLGEAAFDVEPGWLGTPVGSFSEYVERAAGGRAGSLPGESGKSDEDLLGALMAKSL